MHLKTIDLFYIDYLSHIVKYGVEKEDRTNIGINLSIFGTNYHHPLISVGDEFINLPFIQSRRFDPKNSFVELIWMLRGETSTKYLKERNVNFWDNNTSQDFLDKCNKSHIPINTIGKSYSYQMRNFNGIDQLLRIYTSIKDNPFSRRHIISFWNPSELQDMSL